MKTFHDLTNERSALLGKFQKLAADKKLELMRKIQPVHEQETFYARRCEIIETLELMLRQISQNLKKNTRTNSGNHETM